MKKILKYTLAIIGMTIIIGGFFSFSTNNVLEAYGHCPEGYVESSENADCIPLDMSAAASADNVKVTDSNASADNVKVTSSGVTVSTQLINPIKYKDFSEFVKAVIKVAVQVLTPFVVLAFVYSGFLFVKAQGKPEDIEKAKSAIYWSVIGALILFGAWGFAQIIELTVKTITG